MYLELLEDIVGKYGAIPTLRVSARYSEKSRNYQWAVVHYEIRMKAAGRGISNIICKGYPDSFMTPNQEYAIKRMKKIAQDEDRLLYSRIGKIYESDAKLILRDLAKGKTIVGKRLEINDSTEFQHIRDAFAFERL